ncbi:hypothetical protein R3W88_014080 [Solanum pinnatisectum]|uniref:F-box associated beta-propeller type 3 domain-containing protein n=1 Tax=Solanum pinnatisectum TaxID=50273 RepID=A0AAV9KRR0_9SOLN|nr:hypothetical protein R3W88_014080 [Solanum pinnatisectum]
MESKLFDVPISVSNSMLSSKCDCKRRRINQVTIMDFPRAIMVEILSKLPIKLIFRCKFDDDLYGVGGFDKTNLKLIGSYHFVWISNPLLGEYFKVKLPEREKRIRHIHYGFCFSEASGQYKKNWRNVGKAPKPLQGKLSDANVNGTIHWLGGKNLQKSASIYSFNIATEEMKSLPAPSGLDTPSLCLMLAELGNCLCLSDNSSFYYIDIWWMKEYGIAESWTKDRISVILPGIGSHRFIPIIIWKDGEILMQSERGIQLVSYNPKEKMLRKVVNVYGSGAESTRYIPSFYSLKTVMGDTFQISNAYWRTQIV